MLNEKATIVFEAVALTWQDVADRQNSIFHYQPGVVHQQGGGRMYSDTGFADQVYLTTEEQLEEEAII